MTQTVQIQDATTPLSPDVFAFLDYRQFLKTYYEYRKSQTTHFSYTLFGRRLGLCRATIHAIISGRRKLDIKKAPSVAQGCNLKSWEEKYFMALVLWNDCDDEKTKQLYWDRLSSLAPKDGFHILDSREESIVSYWFALALLELVQTKGFRWDTEWISSRFGGKMQPAEVESAIELMLTKGFLQIQGERLVATNKTIVGGPGDITEELLTQYHEKNIPVGMKALRDQPSAKIEFSSLSVAIPEDQVEVLREKMRSFRRDLLEFAQSFKETEQVYQFNMQFFPMSEDVES